MAVADKRHPIPMQELYIETSEQLQALCEKLQGAPWIMLDTEFVREKTYHPQFCLLQICDGRVAACVDPIQIDDLSPLVELLCETECDKVFHAATQDLEIFQNKWQKLPTPLFDTQLAASMVGLGEQIGYASLVNQLLNHQLGKDQTRTDWSKRPLNEQQRRYALDDVIYLAEVYQILKQRLIDLGREEWLTEDFNQLAQASHYQVNLQDCWQKVKGKQHLRGNHLAILQSLAGWREAEAQRANRPKRWILKDEVLVDLSRRKITNVNQLSQIRGLEAGTINRHGETLLGLIEKAKTLPKEQWPKEKDRPPSLSKNQDAQVDLLQSTLRLIAEEHSITPASLASKKELERLVSGNQDVDLMKGWKGKVAGSTLQQVLAGTLTLTMKAGQLSLQPSGE